MSGEPGQTTIGGSFATPPTVLDAPKPVYRRPDAVAHLLGVQVGTLRQWARRGHISPPVDGCYDLAEALTYSDARDVRHFGRALGGRRRRGESRRVACVSSERL